MRAARAASEHLAVRTHLNKLTVQCGRRGVFARIKAQNCAQRRIKHNARALPYREAKIFVATA
jgi:hypothetical protein